MAAGDITVEVTVSGTLTSGDAIAAFSEEKVFSSIADVFQRTLLIGTTVQNILLIGTVAGMTLSALNGLIVRNNDSTNFVTVGLIDDGVKSVYLKVMPGQALVLTGAAIDCDDDAGGALGTLTNIDTVTLKADTAACRCQVIAF